MLAQPAPILTANLDRGFNGQQDQQQQQQRSARSRISNPLHSPMFRGNNNYHQASPLMSHHHVSPFLEHLEPTNSPMLAPVFVPYRSYEISEADPTSTTTTSSTASSAPISTSSLLFSGSAGGGGIGGRKRSTESGYLASPLSQSEEADGNANTNGTRMNRN
ncbi:UNVERIFIED_CONTAM: hypothetical protein HDU68_003864, partial [Siphonaria sp. JEL0065]